MTSASSSTAGCARSHSEKFRVSRPPSTSDCANHDAGATFVYHGQRVRLLWQSAHASVTIARVPGSSAAACVTGGFVVVAAVRDELDEEQHGERGEPDADRDRAE